MKHALFLFVVVAIAWFCYVRLSAYRIDLSHLLSLVLSIVIVLFLLFPLRSFQRAQQRFSLRRYLACLSGDFTVIVSTLLKGLKLLAMVLAYFVSGKLFK